MFRILIAVTLAISTFLVEASASTKRSDRSRDSLVGEVKEVIQESGYREKGETILVQRIVYDLMGNILESEISRNKIGGKTFPERLKTIYERDSEGKALEKRSFDESGKLQGRVAYIYDEKGSQKGNPIEEAHYDKDGKRLYSVAKKYDRDGNEIEEITYLGSGSLKSRSVSSYDGKGNLITYEMFSDCSRDGQCKTLDHKAVNTYDDAGNMTESKIYRANGVMDEKIAFDYDPTRNLVVKARYGADGQLREKEVYAYKFDQAGNWIERSTQTYTGMAGHKKEEPPHQIRRTIIYYQK